MPDPDVIVYAGFRCHVLLPHEVVGTVIDGKPTWDGMTVDTAGVYWRNKQPVFAVATHMGPRTSRVTVKAFRDVWVQEPGLTVKIAGEGTWRGFGPTGEWTSEPYPLHQKDAHRSTVHFSRVKTNPWFTAGVEYRGKDCRIRFKSDGGFTKLLERPAKPVPWQDCEVFGEGYALAGTHVDHDEVLRRWELAGRPPNIGQMHFLGWTGGPGAVVDEKGRENGAPADKYLWQPRSWRRLKPDQSISQTLEARRDESHRHA